MNILEHIHTPGIFIFGPKNIGNYWVVQKIGFNTPKIRPVSQHLKFLPKHQLSWFSVKDLFPRILTSNTKTAVITRLVYFWPNSPYFFAYENWQGILGIKGGDLDWSLWFEAKVKIKILRFRNLITFRLWGPVARVQKDILT